MQPKPTFDICMKSQPKQQRGFRQNYLSQVPVDTLVNNTLTGFLIRLIDSNCLDLETILEQTIPHFPALKNVDGKPYTSKSARRSII